MSQEKLHVQILSIQQKMLELNAKAAENPSISWQLDYAKLEAQKASDSSISNGEKKMLKLQQNKLPRLRPYRASDRKQMYLYMA